MSSKSDYTSPLCSLAEENTNTNHFKLCIVLYLFIRRNYIELTSWELIWWEVDLVGVDLVGVGLVGVDLVGVDLVVASYPGPFEKSEKGPGIHCSRMRLISA